MGYWRSKKGPLLVILRQSWTRNGGHFSGFVKKSVILALFLENHRKVIKTAILDIPVDFLRGLHGMVLDSYCIFGNYYESPHRVF